MVSLSTAIALVTLILDIKINPANTAYIFIILLFFDIFVIDKLNFFFGLSILKFSKNSYITLHNGP